MIPGRFHSVRTSKEDFMALPHQTRPRGPISLRGFCNVCDGACFSVTGGVKLSTTCTSNTRISCIIADKEIDDLFLY